MTWVFTESYTISIKVGHRKENVTEVHYNTLQQKKKKDEKNWLWPDTFKNVQIWVMN